MNEVFTMNTLLTLATRIQDQGLDEDAWRSLRDETEVPALQKPEKAVGEASSSMDGFGFMADLFEGLFWIAMAAAVLALAYVVYQRLRELPQTSARPGVPGTASASVASLGSFAPGQLAQWDQRRRDAEARGDYRMALRWLFLGMLKLLSDQRYIALKRDKTGEAYLRELRKSGLEHGFRQSLRFYERAWFGAMPPNQEQYPAQRAVFENMIETLRA